MNRTGLFIALAVAVIVGVLFSIHAQFDLDLSGLFFDPDTHRFRIYAQPWEQHARDASRWLIILLVAPGFLALGGKLIRPRQRMLIGGRSALFLVLTLALGPGLLANTLLKDHWGRSRPIDVIEFGGADPFTPWWNPGGPCPNNCSFIAGEPSAHSGHWRQPPWRRRNGVCSRMGAQLRLASHLACCAWPPADIFSPTSHLPASSCISSYGRLTVSFFAGGRPDRVKIASSGRSVAPERRYDARSPRSWGGPRAPISARKVRRQSGRRHVRRAIPAPRCRRASASALIIRSAQVNSELL